MCFTKKDKRMLLVFGSTAYILFVFFELQKVFLSFNEISSLLLLIIATILYSYFKTDKKWTPTCDLLEFLFILTIGSMIKPLFF